MSIKDSGYYKKVSRQQIRNNEKICNCHTERIVFSFKYLDAKKLKKENWDLQTVNDLLNKLKVFSELAWDDLIHKNKKSGCEFMPWGGNLNHQLKISVSYY